MKQTDDNIRKRVNRIPLVFEMHETAELRPPDPDQIRNYLKQNRERLSLLAFAEWVVKNSRYENIR